MASGEKLYYEFRLDSDTTTQSGTLPFINDMFNDIVNYDEVNPYYYNSGYKENLDHVNEERSQKSVFGLKKMIPYTKIKLWKRQNDNVENPGSVIEFNDPSRGEYEVTDAVFLDGERYLMVVSEDKTKMKIFKQIHVTEIESCANTCYESGFLGHFIDITRYEYKDSEGAIAYSDYFPFSKCCYDKFLVTSWGKGQRKSSGDQGYMRVDLIGNDLSYSFYDPTNAQFINASAGDFLYINGGALSGQIVPISGTATIENNQGVETAFAWTGVNLVEGQNSAASDPHSWIILPGYGDILNVACLDGLVHINYTNTHPLETETILCGSMASPTIMGQMIPGFLISSMIYFKPIDTIALLDISDGDVKYGLAGYLKFYFKSSNQFYTSKDYTDLVEFGDYLLMLGPNKVSLAYPVIDQSSPGIVRNTYKEILNSGYLSRGSRLCDGSTFILANDKGVWALDIQATSYITADRLPISVERSYQSGPFITDISQFSRELGDECGMSMYNKQFKLFIRNERGTIVWIKSIEHNYRREHLLTSYIDEDGKKIIPRINNYKAGVYIGNGVYDRGGNQEIKTYLSFSYGDKSLLTPKMLHTLKLAIGRDSWITSKNTILEITYTLGGRTYTHRYDDWNVSKWVKDMMLLKQTGNETQLYRTAQNELRMYSGEGHGKYQERMLYNTNKLKAFEEYDPKGDSSSDFTGEYELANFSTLHTFIGMMFDTVTFKLITKGDDALEFYGALIRYQLTNEDGGSLDNSLTILKD